MPFSFCSFILLFFCSFVLLFFCSFVLLFFCSFVLLFFCSFVLLFFCSFVLLFFCSFILLFFYSFILLFFYSFILLFFYSFILLFFYSFILLFFYSFILLFFCLYLPSVPNVTIGTQQSPPPPASHTHARIVYIQKTCQNNHTKNCHIPFGRGFRYVPFPSTLSIIPCFTRRLSHVDAVPGLMPVASAWSRKERMCVAWR